MSDGYDVLFRNFHYSHLGISLSNILTNIPHEGLRETHLQFY